jgi:hypothetical protein
MGDKRSSWRVFLLMALVHLALWCALGAELFVFVPRTVRAFDNLSMKLPWTTERFISVADALVQFPWLCLAVPVLDLLVLFVIHRVLRSRALRIIWSLLVILLLLQFVVFGVLALTLAAAKLQEGLKR